MLRYVLLILSILFVFFVAVIFAAINTGIIELDLAFTRVALQKSLALILFLAIGWVFGVLSAAVLIAKLLSQRRQLRKALDLAESEVKSLRSMPMQDAD
ncbi:MAG: LapA family protein [Gammaproteobacteria bacterium]|jgi:uncharacterized integral membrane protein|nr:LapA family protein [Gammaproteobacteria bacterium]